MEYIRTLVRFNKFNFSPLLFESLHYFCLFFSFSLVFSDVHNKMQWETIQSQTYSGIIGQIKTVNGTMHLNTAAAAAAAVTTLHWKAQKSPMTLCCPGALQFSTTSHRSLLHTPHTTRRWNGLAVIELPASGCEFHSLRQAAWTQC